MSIKEWFEDKRKITALLKNSVERDSKDANETEKISFNLLHGWIS